MFETKITYLEIPQEEVEVFHGIIEAATELEVRKKSLAYAVTYSEKCKDFVVSAIVDREGLKQVFDEKTGTVEYYKLDEYGNVAKNVSIIIRMEPLQTLMDSDGFHSFPEMLKEKK